MLNRKRTGLVDDRCPHALGVVNVFTEDDGFGVRVGRIEIFHHPTGNQARPLVENENPIHVGLVVFALGDGLAEVVATIFEEWLAEAGPADLRSWTFLPDEVRALRLNVAPGLHRVSLALPGTREGYMDFDVEVAAGGFALVNVITATEEGVVRPEPPRGGDLSHTSAGLAALELLA